MIEPLPHQLQGTPTEMSETSGLKKGSLGVGALVFFVISATAPLTTLTGYFPLGVLYGNGAGFPAVFLASMLILLVFSVGYTTMVRHVTNAGAFYALVTRGLGGKAGGCAALVMLTAYNCGQIGMQGLFGVVVASFMHLHFGIELSWWFYCIISVVLIGLLGYRKVDLSLAVLGVLVVGEFLIVLAVDVGVVRNVGFEGFSLKTFDPAYLMAGSVPLALLMSIGSFVGFEATALYSEEAKDPKRTVPRATYLSILIIGFFYCISGLCLVNAVGVDNLMVTLQGMTDPTQLMYDVANKFVSPNATIYIQFLLITSTFASMLAFHNAAARYFYVLGREGLLHHALGRAHARFQSPHLGSLAQTAIAVLVIGYFILAGLDPMLILFAWLNSVGLLGIISMAALVSIAVAMFFLTNSQLESGKPIKTIVLPVASAVTLGLIACSIASNFSLFAGASGFAGIALPATVPLAALVGWVLASRLKKKDLRAFEALGANRF